MASSHRKLRANRGNAQKSTGPRTGAGKLRSSRNAVRHGLTSSEGSPAEAIARIAEELCREDPFPYRQHHAVAIAEAQVVIERIRKARVDTIERLRRVKAPPKGLLNTVVAKIEAGDIKGIIALLCRQTAVNKEMLKRMKAGERTAPKEGIIADYFNEFFGPQDAGPSPPRTDLECVVRALPELARLEHYERRALVRKRRAVRAFAARFDN
ncbi:MAG: hypothetical protein GEU95_24085 [Rhizobiales bacterium]|nr:hypothetical protein [Hyphomicrobiales bacterium]